MLYKSIQCTMPTGVNMFDTFYICINHAYVYYKNRFMNKKSSLKTKNQKTDVIRFSWVQHRLREAIWLEREEEYWSLHAKPVWARIQDKYVYSNGACIKPNFVFSNYINKDLLF